MMGTSKVESDWSVGILTPIVGPKYNVLDALPDDKQRVAEFYTV